MSHPLPRQPAPALSVPTVGGEPWTLADRTPEAYSLVVFYRGLHCPKCKDQLTELDGRLEELAAVGITDVLAVSGDGVERARTTVDDWGLRHLTVGHSLDESTMRAWGLYVSKGINDREPTLFNEPGIALVEADGTVHATWVQSTPFARPHLDNVINSIRWIRETEYPARGEA